MTTLAVDVELTADVLALIADRAAAGDESGHLDPEVVAGLAVTGINRLPLPVELGGLAMPPRRTVEVVEQLAAASANCGARHLSSMFDDSPKPGASQATTVWSRERSGSIHCQMRLSLGAPCSMTSGGPEPARLQAIRIPSTSTCSTHESCRRIEPAAVPSDRGRERPYRGWFR